MRKSRFSRLLLSLLGCCLILLLAACGGNASATAQTGSGNNDSSTVTPNSPAGASVSAKQAPATTPGSTLAVPATLTSCPAAGTARAAVMAPLRLGSHQNLVYIVNEFNGTTPTFGTLKRYDTATGGKTEIVKLANTSIMEAQVSADGQWLLFVSSVGSTEKMQLVRMDGKGLQTLTCGSAIRQTQWSTNEKLIVFAQQGQRGADIKLLNATNGSLETLLASTQQQGFAPRTWLDYTRVYIVHLPTDGPADAVYLLDTSKGANQSLQNLTKVFDATSHGSCWDFDSSYDATKLLVSECTSIPNPNGPGSIGQKGPSSIRAFDATGGNPANPFVTSYDQGITNVRAITNSTLIYQINTTGTSDQNGLWKVSPNGQNGMQLNHVTGFFLNLFSQFPWSNVSRNNSLYALQVISGNRYTLLYGSMNGGNPTTFADISDGTQLYTVGWTTM